jgi:hypothetical protein
MDWPEVLSLPWICRQADWTPARASVYIARWQQQGFLAKAGPRTGLYFNLIKSAGDITTAMRVEALRLAHPTAVLIGESVLHANAWITQVPQALSVAVLSARAPAQMEGFTLHHRPRRWYITEQPHLVKPQDADWSTYGLKAVPPARALIDLYRDPKAWHPDPDDLDLDASAQVGIREALQNSSTEGLPEWLASLQSKSVRRPRA